MRIVVSLESGRPFHVVIRNVTRPFWQACIDAADNPDVTCRVAAFGTAGIGKTACTPYLIKMLLERGTKVVYHVRTLRECGWIYEFIPGHKEEEGEGWLRFLVIGVNLTARSLLCVRDLAFRA